MNETHLLGRPLSYWIEVQHRIDDLGVDHLLRDLAVLSAKVRYYEEMLDRVAAFRGMANKL